MNELEEEMSKAPFSGATFSLDKAHRYALWRMWDKDLPRILFIGLNPSRGNEFYNDPTLTRCINFSKSWNYGTMLFGNLYSNISPDPDLIKKLDPKENIFAENVNDHSLDEMLGIADDVVIAWGSWNFIDHRKNYVLGLISKWFDKPLCFGTNKDGNPKHPLYLKATAKTIFYQ